MRFFFFHGLWEDCRSCTEIFQGNTESYFALSPVMEHHKLLIWNIAKPTHQQSVLCDLWFMWLLSAAVAQMRYFHRLANVFQSEEDLWTVMLPAILFHNHVVWWHLSLILQSCRTFLFCLKSLVLTAGIFFVLFIPWSVLSQQYLLLQSQCLLLF